MITDPLAILVCLAIVVWSALRLERAFAPFRALGSGLVAILLGMSLSNGGVVAGVSTTYAQLGSTGVSLAVALILMSVDVRTVRQAGPRMLAAFGIGAAATVIGAITGTLLWADAVGPEAWKLAGQFTGTYVGGGMNFAALARTFDTSTDMFSAAVAADVALTALWMAACLAAPLLLGGRRAAEALPAVPTPAGAEDRGLDRALDSSLEPLTLADIAALAALAVGALWASRQLAAAVPVLPAVLWLTTLALLLAQIPGVRALNGGAVLGHYLLLLFLAGNGAQSVLANIFRVGPAVFWFALTTVAVHGVLIFGIGRLVGLDAGTLAVASQANIGGPPSAVALAGARGYGDLVLPGVAVGLLGYAAGNYLGFVVGSVMRQLIG